MPWFLQFLDSKPSREMKRAPISFAFLIGTLLCFTNAECAAAELDNDSKKGSPASHKDKSIAIDRDYKREKLDGTPSTRGGQHPERRPRQIDGLAGDARHRQSGV
jgi:hypothetical protein